MASFKPFSKYEAPMAGHSFVIYRRTIGHLDLRSGDELVEGLCSFAGLRGADSEGFDALDAFEPAMIREPAFEEESRSSLAGQRIREAAAILGLIAVAIIGAGLWSRSEADAMANQVRAAPPAVIQIIATPEDEVAANDPAIAQLGAEPPTHEIWPVVLPSDSVAPAKIQVHAATAHKPVAPPSHHKSQPAKARVHPSTR